MFPDGTPTTSELDTMWKSQKRGGLSDNMIDDVQYWLARHP